MNPLSRTRGKGGEETGLGQAKVDLLRLVDRMLGFSCLNKIKSTNVRVLGFHVCRPTARQLRGPRWVQGFWVCFLLLWVVGEPGSGGLDSMHMCHPLCRASAV